MNPQRFGRQIRLLLRKQAADPTWGQFGAQLANTLNPFGKPGPKGTNYLDTFDKWYNPWTKNTDPMSKGENTLMRMGQGAMGIGAAAGAAAGGMVAAPAAAAAGNTAAAGLGTAGAAIGTGAQRATQAAGNVFQRGGQMLQNATNTYTTRVQPTLDKIKYKPEDIFNDIGAAASGNFDGIKGPGLPFKTPSQPAGAPSLPRPKQIWQDVNSAVQSVSKQAPSFFGSTASVSH